jgi:hypothetical protein
VSKRLEKRISAETVQGFTVDGIRTYGSRGALVVAVTLKAPVQGTVYLVGSPRLERPSALVVVPQLGLTDASRRALRRAVSAEDIARFEAGLRHAAHFALDAPSTIALDLMRRGSSTNTKVRVHTPDVRELSVQATARGLKTSLLSSGMVQLRL